jgi:hypothetical protein
MMAFPCERRRGQAPGAARTRRSRRRAIVASVVLGCALGVAVSAWATTNIYVGPLGTIPAQGSGASTPGTAPRTDNLAWVSGSNCMSGYQWKAYYIRQDGSVYSSNTCANGSNTAAVGTSGATYVYSRCSTLGGYAVGGGECETDY